jgi:hypothetical protein
MVINYFYIKMENIENKNEIVVKESESSDFFYALRQRLIQSIELNKKRAAAYLHEWASTFNQYEDIKGYLRTKRHFYLNYCLGLFGYKYESSIPNANFAHFAAQAWIISAF